MAKSDDEAHDDITPEDRPSSGELQERDLPPAPPKLIQLLQPNSMKLLEQIPDAKAGDFAMPHDGEYLLFRGATGVPFIPIGFAQAFVEWGQGRSGYVDSHPKKPRDAVWGDGRDIRLTARPVMCVKAPNQVEKIPFTPIC